MQIERNSLFSNILTIVKYLSEEKRQELENDARKALEFAKNSDDAVVRTTSLAVLAALGAFEFGRQDERAVR